MHRRIIAATVEKYYIGLNDDTKTKAPFKRRGQQGEKGFLVACGKPETLSRNAKHTSPKGSGELLGHTRKTLFKRMESFVISIISSNVYPTIYQS